jgi:hypothetical protein
MPANTDPVFTLTPRITGVHVAAANTASDGSGSLVTAFTAGTFGSRLDEITVTNAQASAAASSAMVIRVFITDTSGANPRLLREQAMPTATRSTTAVGAQILFSFAGGLTLASGQLIQVCQSVYAGVQDQNSVVCRGGDY